MIRKSKFKLGIELYEKGVWSTETYVFKACFEDFDLAGDGGSVFMCW